MVLGFETLILRFYDFTLRELTVASSRIYYGLAHNSMYLDMGFETLNFIVCKLKL